MERRLGLVVALVALVAYAATLAPGVTSEDAGELVAAAAVLGVPHPPGFPLWVVLVHLATAISPAPAAVTANFVSGLFAAGTAGAVAVLGRRLGASSWAAAAGGLLVAFGPTFWSQAVIAEVYSLNTLLLAFALVCIVGWGRGQPESDDRGLRLAAALCGLALTNHYPLTLLVGPAFAVYALQRGGRALLAPRRLIPVVLCVLVPLLLYAYLPWAASRAPAANWGDPSTFEAFRDHVSRRAYRELELSEAVTLDDKLSFIGLFSRLWLRELTPWALLVGGLAGVYALRRRAELALLGLVVLGNSVVLLLILRFRFEEEHIMRVNEYFLPTYVASGALIAMGLHTLSTLPAFARARTWAGAALLAFPALSFGLHVSDVDMSDYHLAEDFNRYILVTLPRDAVYFPSGDYASFPALYFTAVEGLRDDVLLGNYTGTPSKALRDYVAEIAPGTDLDDRRALQQALLDKSRRPVVFASKSDVRLASPQLTPWGLVHRAWRPDETPTAGPDPRKLPILQHNQRPGPVDDLGRSILTDYHRGIAEAHAGAGDAEAARASLEAAGRWASNSKEGLNNLGSTAAEYGYDALAITFFERAAGLSPRYVTPRRNLALLYDRLGPREAAIEAFEALVKAAPEDTGAQRRLEALRAPSPAEQRVIEFERATREEPLRAPLWNNLGTAYVQAGRPKDALRAYEEAIRLAPDYVMAHEHIAALYAQFFDDAAAAARHRAKAEALRAATPR